MTQRLKSYYITVIFEGLIDLLTAVAHNIFSCIIILFVLFLSALSLLRIYYFVKNSHKSTVAVYENIIVGIFCINLFKWKITFINHYRSRNKCAYLVLQPNSRGTHFETLLKLKENIWIVSKSNTFANHLKTSLFKKVF